MRLHFEEFEKLMLHISYLKHVLLNYVLDDFFFLPHFLREAMTERLIIYALV
jgi:hypothetical protein